MGSAAAVLNEMLETTIELQVPHVRVIDADQLNHELQLHQQRISNVYMKFEGPFAGSSALIFPPQSAEKLVAALSGEEVADGDRDGLWAGTLTEVGNIVLNYVIGAISNVLDIPFDYSVPQYSEDEGNDLIRRCAEGEKLSIILAQTQFKASQLQLEGDVLLFFETPSFDALLRAIDEAG